MPLPIPVASPEAAPKLPIGAIVLDKDRLERVVTLIPADVQLPCELCLRFASAYVNMTAVRLELTVGPGDTRAEVTVLGKVELTGLAPLPQGSPLEVTLQHQGDTLRVRLTDVASGTSREAEFAVHG
jgi:hypothetical protein